MKSELDLTKLFSLQKDLDVHIIQEQGLEGRDLLKEKSLALFVELGELANEWRGFKFWSKDRKPRTEELVECDSCGGSGRDYSGYCGNCHGGYVGKRNLLLEEYVDCLSFVLTIGLEMKLSHINYFAEYQSCKVIYKSSDLVHQFNSLFIVTGCFVGTPKEETYTDLFCKLLGLGEALLFSWSEIEEAYMKKNAINHQRQVSGY